MAMQKAKKIPLGYSTCDRTQSNVEHLNGNPESLGSDRIVIIFLLSAVLHGK